MNFKHIRKTIKLLTAGTMAMSLFFAANAAAFAQLDKNGAVAANGQESVKAAVTKVLEMGETTNTPAATFTFTLE